MDELADASLNDQNPVSNEGNADEKPDRDSAFTHTCPVLNYQTTMLTTTKQMPTTMAQNAGR